MKAAGIIFVAFAGLSVFWILTGKQTGVTTSISSPLNSIGGLAGQGLSTLGSAGQSNDAPIAAGLGTGLTAPAPAGPETTGLLGPLGGFTAPTPTPNSLFNNPSGGSIPGLNSLNLLQGTP